MGIDKGNTNYDVMLFDSIYGVQYPGVSGMEGGGNAVHFLYNILGTPSIVVITPDKLIASKQIWPPTTDHVIDSVLAAGGILQPCITSVDDNAGTAVLLSVNPNPVKDVVFLSIYPDRTRQLEVIIRNAAGRHIAGLAPSVYEPVKNHRTLSLTGLAGGLYFLQLLEKGKPVLTDKIILLP